MNDVAKQAVVLPVPEGTEFRQETGFKFGSTGRTMDLCYPNRDTDDGWPLTVLVGGFPDSGFEQGMGCKFKEMASLKSWSQLIASTGIVAVTYECEDPLTDLLDVIACLKEKADDLGVDRDRIALWSCSGNSPTALGAIAELPTDIRCAVTCYGYLVDQPGHTAVAAAASRFHFANPMEGHSIRELDGTPLMIVRAGADEMPGLNDTIDRFVAESLHQDLPVTLVNYPSGAHSFDLWDDSEHSKAICRGVLNYLERYLISSA